MKNMFSLGPHTLFTIAVLFLSLTASQSLRPHHSTFNWKGSYGGEESPTPPKEGAEEGVGVELYPTGSSLPDCSHACGPCFPCKRVIVSFKCAVESCPIVYRCMCKGKYYHVPSN